METKKHITFSTPYIQYAALENLHMNEFSIDCCNKQARMEVVCNGSMRLNIYVRFVLL